MPDAVKVTPSLDATLELTDANQNKLRSYIFGTQQFIDPAKFAELCFASWLPAIRADLLEANDGRFAAEIGAVNTQEDLATLLAREDVVAPRLARRAATAGGSLQRIDAVEAASGGLTLNWSAAGTGFGQLYFYTGPDGKLHVDSECMGRHFLRSVLLRLADELVIDE